MYYKGVLRNMESVIRPLSTVSYEIAYRIISDLLQKGLITKTEFAAIDAQNKKSFCI